MFKFAEDNLAIVTRALSIGATAAPEQVQVDAINDRAGDVTVSHNGVVTRAVSGAPLYEGKTTMVASDGRAKVKLASGCDLALCRGEYSIVNGKMSRQEWQASALQLTTPYRVSQIGEPLHPVPAAAV